VGGRDDWLPEEEGRIIASMGGKKAPAAAGGGLLAEEIKGGETAGRSPSKDELYSVKKRIPGCSCA